MLEETIITEYYMNFDFKIATNQRMDQLLLVIYSLFFNISLYSAFTAGTKKVETKNSFDNL